eukprot:scaffold115568_cov18-Tisochrysis_lutea.AAC.2
MAACNSSSMTAAQQHRARSRHHYGGWQVRSSTSLDAPCTLIKAGNQVELPAQKRLPRHLLFLQQLVGDLGNKHRMEHTISTHGDQTAILPRPGQPLAQNMCSCSSRPRNGFCLLTIVQCSRALRTR